MSFFHTIIMRCLQFVFISLLLMQFVGCGDDINASSSAYWEKTSTVSVQGGVASIVISGNLNVNWSAQIVTKSDWCSFGNSGNIVHQISGYITGVDDKIYIYCKTNNDSVARNATIKLKFEGEDELTFVLTQTASFARYFETPAIKINANYQYVTHYSTVGGKNVRNYSMCFDKSKRLALWVAYPIHSIYLGSIGRTDEWGYDPEIENKYQVDCVSRSFGGSYDRGHQIASADRLANRQMNVQTFYMTNMTPQFSSLNQLMWAKLEMKVRSYNCSDTLYVVTGIYFDSAGKTTTDGGGNYISIPTHYFKVLLRTKTGTTGKSILQCKPNELKTIGFWVEHKSYGDIEPPRSICTSVAEIERKTGFDFFPKVAQEVKQQNDPTQWAF